MLLYRKIPMSSKSQFIKDFGEYPPFPLRPASKDVEFDVVHICGFGYFYYIISRGFKTLTAALKRGRSGVTTGNQKYYDVALQKFFDSYNKMNSATKIMFTSTIILLSPVILVITIALAFQFMIRQSRNLGLYNPVWQVGKELVVMPSKILNIEAQEVSLESVISHEHIHLRQDHLFSRPRLSADERDRFKSKFEDLINTNDFNSARSLYLLGINEVEARLHEVVISHYIEHSSIPTSSDDFISMLLCTETLGDYISNNLVQSNYRTHPRDFGVLKLRTSQPALDIILTLSFFKNTDLRMRYILEVLVVMYGNLIILYGDKDKALEYFSTIKKFDLYIELYGDIESY